MLHTFLIDYGLHQLKCDSACYALLTPTIAAYDAAYVDYVLMFNTDPQWSATFKIAFGTAFNIKDLGSPVRVFGMSVFHDRSSSSLLLHQGPYIRDMLHRFNMTDCKPVLYPNFTADIHASSPLVSPEDHIRCRQIVGSLICLACVTRLDIDEAVSRLCRSMHAPTVSNLQAALYALRYLKGTLELGITYTAQRGSIALISWPLRQQLQYGLQLWQVSLWLCLHSW